MPSLTVPPVPVDGPAWQEWVPLVVQALVSWSTVLRLRHCSMSRAQIICVHVVPHFGGC
jgi:hypothetical protein